MDCPKCGYAMSDFDVDCPRCRRLAEQDAHRHRNAPQPQLKTPTEAVQSAPQVAEYVANARADGFSDDMIYGQLLQAGWDVAAAHEAMRLDEGVTPSEAATAVPGPRASMRSEDLIGRVIAAVVIFVAVFGLIQHWLVGGIDTRVDDVQAVPWPSQAEGADTRVNDVQGGQWVKVTEWRGNGIKRTETFTVGREWAVEWATQPDHFEGTFSVLAYHTNGEMGPLLANLMGSGHDTSYVYESGTFFLEINSTQPWHVTVWEKR